MSALGDPVTVDPVKFRIALATIDNEAAYSERMIPTSPDQFDRGRASGLRLALKLIADTVV